MLLASLEVVVFLDLPDLLDHLAQEVLLAIPELLVAKETLDLKESLVPLVNKVLLVLLVRKEREVPMERLDLLVPLAMLELEVFPELVVCLDPMVELVE